jgi:prepilin-type N-terminal cleavage/methylation domain-containing protein
MYKHTACQKGRIFMNAAKHHSCMNLNFRGFTLIELLVVVAIISVLIALLIPALNHARVIAKQTQCASNLRQIGITYQTYAGEHNSFLPVPRFSVIYTNVLHAPDWAYGGVSVKDAGTSLLPYIPNGKIFFCPSDGYSIDWFDDNSERWAKNQAQLHEKWMMSSYMHVFGNQFRIPVSYANVQAWLDALLPPVKVDDPPDCFLAQDLVYWENGAYVNHGGGFLFPIGANLLQLDGHASWYASKDFNPTPIVPGGGVAYKVVNKVCKSY